MIIVCSFIYICYTFGDSGGYPTPWTNSKCRNEPCLHMNFSTEPSKNLLFWAPLSYSLFWCKISWGLFSFLDPVVLHFYCFLDTGRCFGWCLVAYQTEHNVPVEKVAVGWLLAWVCWKSVLSHSVSSSISQIMVAPVVTSATGNTNLSIFRNQSPPLFYSRIFGGNIHNMWIPKTT